MAYPTNFNYTPLGKSNEKGDLQRPYTIKSLALKITSFVVILLPYVYILYLKTQPHQKCGLNTDILFGEIPFNDTVIENDDVFLHTDPFVEGKKWVMNPPWDEMYLGSWIALTPSPGQVPAREIQSGMRMRSVAADPSEWEEESRGFGVAMVIKHTLIEFQADGSSKEDLAHVHHCIETLRQAVKCHADLALEHPSPQRSGTKKTQTVSGWGNTHFCRHWPSVADAIKKRSIERDGVGKWLRSGSGSGSGS
ncbi:hypothetical protein JHW43_005901 [Diplocarpon mali]|nr:hypothetical protein JHW43_005901 [Diplocarpon mali]